MIRTAKIFIIVGFLIMSILLITGCVQKNEALPKSAQFVNPSYQHIFFEPSNKEHFENEKFPLILFLHGAGERGADLEKLYTHGPPKLSKTDTNFPFGVLAPLCPADKWWDAAKILELLNTVVAENPKIDSRRIYLSGLSMGGYGSWDLACLAPDSFAALAVICGGSLEHTFRAGEIKHIPTWVFHGAKDEVVPLENSESIVNALKAKGADVKFTIYPDAGHDSWTETYDNPELYTWLLEHDL